MDKRYQVFVSSTFRDLKDERREVMEALLECDCIPAQMELFPAANEQAWELVERVISQSDYYILIIGGVYGTTDEEGISFTEREYDLAIDLGIPILPFIIKSNANTTGDKIEIDGEAQDKLASFRSKIEEQHHCKYWTSAEDLGGKVSRSISKTKTLHPRTGWVRGDHALTTDKLEEINRLRADLDAYKNHAQNLPTSPPPGTENLARGRDVFKLHVAYSHKGPGDYTAKGQELFDFDVRWDSIFDIIGPLLIPECSEDDLRFAISTSLRQAASKDLQEKPGHERDIIHDIQITHDCFNTIKIQLIALGMIAESSRRHAPSDKAIYWSATPYGQYYFTRLKAVKRPE